MRKTYLLLFIFLLLGVTTFANINRPTYQTQRASAPPKIDGILNDNAWRGVPFLSDFTQSSPIEKAKPSQRTEVKIIYDDFAIYVGAMLYDTNPDSILAELSNRDDHSINADLFRIAFDTYNKEQEAYYFEVAASGVQLDWKSSDGSFDAIWESKTKITAEGWVVEIKIPYSAIRFPSEEIQTWGLQCTRSIRRHREFNQWAFTPKGTANSLMHWGSMEGIKDINAPLRLSFTPYISGVYENAPIDDESSYSNSFSYNFGADMKYGIDERFTLDMTLFPDFSQVQSDKKVKNLSYREVTYGENREFFSESTELFNTYGLFYSRRIGQQPKDYDDVEDQLIGSEEIIENPSKNKLLNASKISGRNNNGLAIGFFNAVTDNMYAEVKDSLGNKRKILTDPLTNYNIVVFDQQMKNNSNVYFINTNVIRTKGQDDANVSAVGFEFFNKKKVYSIEANSALSQSFEKIDSMDNAFQNQMGYRYDFEFGKRSGNFQFDFEHSYIDKDYDSRDLGYYIIGNKMTEELDLEYNFYNPTKLFKESYNGLYLTYQTNPITHERTYAEARLRLMMTSHKYTTFVYNVFGTPFDSYDYYEPRTDGRFSRRAKYYYNSFYMSTDYRKALALDLSLEFGDFLNEDYDAGESYGYQAKLRYRVNNHLQISLTNHYNYDSYNLGYASTNDNDEIFYGGRSFTINTNSLYIRYVIVNDMTITMNARHYWNIGEYKDFYFLEENGDLTLVNDYEENHDFNFNAFNIDLVYSWQFSPGSILSFAYKNAIEDETESIIKSYAKNWNHTFSSPQQNVLSLKLLYYLDYNYLKKIGTKNQS